MINTSQIYPSDFESKVGFDGVRRILSDLCQSDMGKTRCAEMEFLTDRTIILRLLHQTSEMVRALGEGSGFPSDSLYDIAPLLQEARVEGSFLTATALHKLRQSLRTMDSIRIFFCGSEEGKPKYPVLSQCFSEIQTFPDILKDIDGIIDRFGELRDTASPRLYELRRSIASVQSSMSTVMQRVMDRAVSAGIIDRDIAPAMRDGRLCIPVDAVKKKSVSGIVHDRSATGKTIFIEPGEIVEAGNRLRELQLDEQREQVIILTAATDKLRPYFEDVIASVRMLGVFDFIRAKAKFALMIDGQLPTLEQNMEIDWYHAVHPMLLISLRRQNREVVPLNIRLGGEKRILIISGPNAGGKSVCLKTVGILQYMLQCGLLPSVHSNSHFSVFNKIFIDIGDQQSIENDLSTYSSHLRNMKKFLLSSDTYTLLLADEMGSGTEPQIGGALAQAILLKLNEKKAMGIVTTHYQNLKTLADTTEGFVNGAMLYDRQHLKPLFQLSVGTPGSSFALEIAGKIGLPKEVVDKAKEIVGEEYVKMDSYLLDIARDRRYWANKRLAIKEKEQKLDRLLSNYEESAGVLRQQRAAILRDAKSEAKDIMATANAKIERAILEIRKSQAEKERTKEIRKELDDYRSSLSDERKSDSLPKELKPLKHKSRSKTKVKAEFQSEDNNKIEVGSYVKMNDGGVVGQVNSIEGKKAEVVFGSLRTIVPLTKLIVTKTPKSSERANLGSPVVSDDSRQRQLKFRQELDVRGMRADEALQALIYFMDDAVQFSASRVRILHGTGHGILRQIIRQQLSVTPGVKSFADEDVRFGGAGITVVELS